MEKINTDYKRRIWKIEAKLFNMRKPWLSSFNLWIVLWRAVKAFLPEFTRPKTPLHFCKVRRFCLVKIILMFVSFWRSSILGLGGKGKTPILPKNREE